MAALAPVDAARARGRGARRQQPESAAAAAATEARRQSVRPQVNQNADKIDELWAPLVPVETTGSVWTSETRRRKK